MKAKIRITQNVPVHNGTVKVVMEGVSTSVSLFANELYNMVHVKFIESVKLPPAYAEVLEMQDDK